MLLFDETKALERAIGEEGAQAVVRMLEKWESERLRDVATKLDLAKVEALKIEISNASVEISKVKADVIKWVAGMLVAQAALIATLVKLL